MKKVSKVANPLPGRTEEIALPEYHFVLKTPLKGVYTEKASSILFGMGCFWGAEKRFWQLEGIIVTAVGYAGGTTKNPTYEEVCSGMTNHAEVVKVVFNPEAISLIELLKVFWEEHDPTQYMRQGNDIGTQYRSTIYTQNSEDLQIALDSSAHYQSLLKANSLGNITTEILIDTVFYFAEGYHQQYLAKNPTGYCGLRGSGVAFVN